VCLHNRRNELQRRVGLQFTVCCVHVVSFRRSVFLLLDYTQKVQTLLFSLSDRTGQNHINPKSNRLFFFCFKARVFFFQKKSWKWSVSFRVIQLRDTRAKNRDSNRTYITFLTDVGLNRGPMYAVLSDAHISDAVHKGPFDIVVMTMVLVKSKAMNNSKQCNWRKQLLYCQLRGNPTWAVGIYRQKIIVKSNGRRNKMLFVSCNKTRL